MIIGGVVLLIIVTFIIIFVVRANMPHCPETCKPGLCDSSADCGEDTNYQCVTVPKADCDLELEMKKTACGGKVGSLVKFFDTATNECVTDEDSKVVAKPYNPTDRLTSGAGKYRITTKLDQPFNLKTDEVQIDFVAEQLNTQNLRITHVELDGSDAQRNTVILGEQNINRPVSAVQTPARTYLRLDVPGNDPNGQLKDLKLLIDIAYSTGTGSSMTDKTDRLTVTLRNLAFSWLRPTRAYACPTTSACDDNDPSTRDYCDASSAPFCKHDAITGACGNGVCESGENKCTCTGDCGQCGGTGKVTQSQCVNNACSIQLRSDVVVEPIKLSVQNKLGKVTVTTALEYNKPFNSRDDKVKITIKMDESDKSVTRFSIDSVQLLKGANIEISSAPLGNSLAPGGSVTAVLPMTTQLVEEDITPQLKVSYTMTTATGPDSASYLVNPQRVTVYSP
jgi:hypothetical protein